LIADQRITSQPWTVSFMRILLTSHGSTGDIYPVIAYGKALRMAGHTVSFASAPLYREEIEKADLNFIHVPPDWRQEIFTEFMRELDRAKFPLLQLREIYRGALPFLGELIDRIEQALREHDVLVSSYLFPHYKVIADRQNKPFISFAFCHNTVPSDDYSPELFPSLRGLPKPIQTWWNRSCWKFANWIVDRSINFIIGDELERKHLPPAKDFILKPSDLVLLIASKDLMAGRGRMDPRFQFTGYLRWQSAEDPAMEQSIASFCQGEKVPVLTFGSVAFDDTHLIMSRFEHNWPKDRKLILQSGWSGLSVEWENSNILVVGKMSHDQLFKHASSVIHHGGAGTTASVLAAGVPQVIIPHIADQRFWGAEVERLGAGLVLSKRRWPERITKKVKQVEDKPRYTEAAQKASLALANEDGPSRAVSLLESFVANYRASRSAHIR